MHRMAGYHLVDMKDMEGYRNVLLTAVTVSIVWDGIGWAITFCYFHLAHIIIWMLWSSGWIERQYYSSGGCVRKSHLEDLLLGFYSVCLSHFPPQLMFTQCLWKEEDKHEDGSRGFTFLSNPPSSSSGLMVGPSIHLYIPLSSNMSHL